MYKKYDCLNDDGSYDAYNSCYLHNDNKGFNFYMLNDKDCGVTIFARTKENEFGKYETNIQIKDYDEKGQEEERYNLTFTTFDEVNLETVYEAFEDEFSKPSNKPWWEVFEDFSFIHEPEKVSGKIHNSSLWNDLKDLDNVHLEISQDWKYNLDKNVNDVYIKNQKENLKFHSEGNNDFSYQEKMDPNIEDGIKIVYLNYGNVPDFIIDINKQNNVTFNCDPVEKVMVDKSLHSKEDVDYFISNIRERIPDTYFSSKATALLKKSLYEVIEKKQEKQSKETHHLR